jgi:DNA-binding CsgD family transcriptional regulator
MRAQVLPTEECYEDRRRRIRSEARSAIAALTPRETEVLHAIGKGKNIPESAAQLGVSQHTIRAYMTSIAAKIRMATKRGGARCRYNSMRTLALRAGLTSIWA